MSTEVLIECQSTLLKEQLWGPKQNGMSKRKKNEKKSLKRQKKLGKTHPGKLWMVNSHKIIKLISDFYTQFLKFSISLQLKVKNHVSYIDVI